MLLFLLSWETGLRKHWYNLCQNVLFMIFSSSFTVSCIIFVYKLFWVRYCVWYESVLTSFICMYYLLVLALVTSILYKRAFSLAFVLQFLENWRKLALFHGNWSFLSNTTFENCYGWVVMGTNTFPLKVIFWILPAPFILQQTIPDLFFLSTFPDIQL